MDQIRNGIPIRKPLRMREYDYSTSGTYFVTICAQNTELRFGGLSDGILKLNEAGNLIVAEWIENASRHLSVQLDEFVVMPNHIHAIVFLGSDPNATNAAANLSRVVQSFKSSSTVKYIAGVKDGRFPPFNKVLWQRGFHDRILRNQYALDGARVYIDGNPERWLQKANNPPTGLRES